MLKVEYINQCGTKKWELTSIPCDCTPQPNVPTIQRSGNVLTVSGYNGQVDWYRDGVLLQSNATQITLTQNGVYTAKCTTTCGTGGSSNSINVSDIGSGCIETPTKPVISANKLILNQGEQATLTATSCNGVVSWFNGNTQIGTGGTIQVGVGTYVAKCTICNSSLSSDPITITLNGNGQNINGTYTNG